MMTDEMIDWLKAESARTGAPQAEIIRRAIDRYRGSKETDEKRNGKKVAKR